MLRKRILFAWELGANLGHLARDIPVAEQLRKLGHDVTFAARDLRVAQEMLAPRGASASCRLHDRTRRGTVSSLPRTIPESYWPAATEMC